MPPDPEVFAKRYLQFAEAHPGGFAGLVALCRAAFLAPASEAGAKAISLLEGGRVATADLEDLYRALDASRTTRPERTGEKALAPQVLAAVKRQLAHPSAAKLLTWVCVTFAKEQSTSAVFAESADLIVARFANSPDIGNLCELIGNSPRWSAKAEQDLRTILDKNQDRAVRAAAAFALASVVQRAGESRQDEAEALFEDFVRKFDGKEQYQYAAIEKMLNESARRELAELKTRALGKPAPEIEGIDLEGRGMTLSQFRGKVVLLSFWATWCGPCMKMVPHEKSLAERLRNKPFELVGVNGDIDSARLKEGMQKYGITWRSFQNKAGHAQAISKTWNIGGWPTMYLIDQHGHYSQSVDRHRAARGVKPRSRCTHCREIQFDQRNLVSAADRVAFPLGRDWSTQRGCARGCRRRKDTETPENVALMELWCEQVAKKRSSAASVRSAATQKIGRPRPVQLLWSLSRRYSAGMNELKTFRHAWPVWRMICVMLYAVITAGLALALFQPDSWLSWSYVGLAAAAPSLGCWRLSFAICGGCPGTDRSAQEPAGQRRRGIGSFGPVSRTEAILL